jgi:outer membrane protein OmpA-like peptidoglycan-associated protein
MTVPAPGRTRRWGTLGGLLLGCAVVVAVGSAAAASPVRLDDAPVLDVVAPVLDINMNTSDLRGGARVEAGPRQVKVRLDSTVLFGKDSPRLRAGARARLLEVAGQLKAKGPGDIRIVGYTDDLGSAQHGLVLSRQRAQAVASVLRPRLARGYSFSVTGKGEADPAVPNDSEEHRRTNRRVELTFNAS